MICPLGADDLRYVKTTTVWQSFRMMVYMAWVDVVTSDRAIKRPWCHFACIRPGAAFASVYDILDVDVGQQAFVDAENKTNACRGQRE
jgi:hypothetical protein